MAYRALGEPPRESPMTATTIGVFGGAFDPPHLGHVLLAAWLRARGLVDRVIVAPCVDHPFGKPMSPFADRLEWTRAAMADLGDFVETSAIEAELDAAHGPPSHTLRLLEAIAARHPGARVRWVMGSDIVARGETARWHRWDEIERRFPPVIVPRAGFSAPGECPLPEVSSTEVRDWLARDDDDARLRLAAALPARVLARMRAPLRGRVWMVGQGNVAAHATPWLRARGWAVDAIGGHAAAEDRASWPAQAPAAIWILVRDPAMPAVCAALARAGLPDGQAVLHGSGTLRADDPRALGSVAERFAVGTLHPICSLRKQRVDPRLFERTAFGLEGAPAADAIARAFVGEQPIVELGGFDAMQRRRYHGACALVANHLAAIELAGDDALASLGIDPGLRDHVLGVLLESALGNLRALGFPAGVSGPAARGDLAAVAHHRDALPPRAAELYDVLARQLVERLRERGT
jgi:nicotinate (nicotinamide) nucleotide adenylyltransferase